MLKKVTVEQAVGMVLAHDITQIVPGVSKGPLFRKGYIVTEKDIPKLLNCGKEHLYLWENQQGMVHEDDAASRLARAAVGDRAGFEISEPKEGKVNLSVNINGLLKVDIRKLASLNSQGKLMMATAHTDTPVRRGDVVAGTRIIPLLIEEEKIRKAESILTGGDALLKVMPYQNCQAGLVITGSEVKTARIKDSFGPVVEGKLAAFDVIIRERHCVGDDYRDICQTVQSLAEKCGLVIVTGGMSVDPDDSTPRAIRETGAEVISYGVPVLPGAMFMLAYLNNKPVMGLPGCVMYARTTVFDLILPRLLAGERVSAPDLSALGHGGLCHNCQVCHYPDCGFGKTSGPF